MIELQEIIIRAKEELTDRISTEKYPENLVCEIVDNYVPVHTYELMELASNHEIFHYENEPLAFNGEATFNKVYELITESLFEHLRKLQEGAT